MSAPKAVGAERALLGGLLMDPVQVSEVAAILKPADFYVASHGHVFAWLTEQARTNSHTDIISLSDYMVGSDNIERMGGIAYATGLPEHCPSTSNLSHYAQRDSP